MKLLLEIIRKKMDFLCWRVVGIILIISIFIIDGASSQDLKFSHITTEDGLSNNTVHCVYQDSRGFMWFGTDDGLNLYNGYEFTIFKLNAQDTNSLSSNSVFRILEDSKGRLWIAASSGIDIFNRETISFDHIPFVDDFNSSRYHSYTRAITEDQNGNIIIANAVGVFVYDTLQKGFVRFLKDSPNYEVLRQEGIRDLHIDRNSRLWVGSLGLGLYCFDLEKNEIIASQSFKERIDINERIYTIAEEMNGDIWLGTDNGIYIIKSDLSNVSRILKSDGLPSNNIRTIFIEDNNLIWVGTDGGGLCLINKSENKILPYKSNEFDSYSLNNNSVQSIWKDKQGILWLGTYQGGVNYASSKSGLRFNHMTSIKGNKNSLGYNVVSAIYEDKEGNLWIGTDGGGLDFYNTKTKTFKHYKFEPANSNSINGNVVLAITEDINGNIWIGGYLQGINIIEKATGRIRSYKHDPRNPNSLSNDDVRDILIQDKNTVWIATNGGGLNLFNPEINSFTHFREGQDNALVDDWSIKLFLDSYGYLWIGTYDGLSIYSPKNNTFRNYSQSNNPGSLSNAWVYTFAEDKLGNIWIGTANGLNYYDRDKQILNSILTSEILPNEVINGILIDNQENLWMSTNKGISRFNPTDTTSKNFDVFDGLQGMQFVHGSYLKTRDGEMYFGGLNGLNYFYPDSIHDSQYKPNVYLTDFLIFFERANVNAPGSPLSKSITESKKIILNYKQSVITFKYAALNYFNTEKNQYKYILEGSEKDWNKVGTRREATYTNLSPGKYTFKVMASNNDGVWNEKAASIRVIILPPWWKTLLFRILIIVIITSAVVGYYFYRINDLKKRQVQLEELVERRTKEIKEKNTELAKQSEEMSEYNTLLEERQQMIEEQTEELVAQKEQLEHANMNLEELNLTKNKFFSIIAHDLKNPFNTILGFAELLNKRYDSLSEEKRRSFSKAIYESSENVFNLLDNLLMWARSQTDRLTLDPVNFNMNILIEENIELLKEMFNNKKIDLSFESPELYDVHADRNMINTVIRNLMTNAVKFTNENGTVSITLTKENNEIVLRVKDNGVGIAEEDKGKLFRLDGQFQRDGTGGELGTGLGLLLCKEYIEKNNGRIWLDSKEDEGSTFQFALPTSI